MNFSMQADHQDVLGRVIKSADLQRAHLRDGLRYIWELLGKEGCVADVV